MTGSELKTFVTDGLGTGDIGDTEFYILLNAAKTKIEGERNWKTLEITDTSQTVSSGDTFLTQKTLPTDFAEDIGLFLTNSANQASYYHPIPFLERYQRKNEPNGYWIDLANGKFGLTGIAPAGYTTINLVYKKTSVEISSTTSWVFPSRFHPLLGFLVAVSFKGGVDFDSISAKQALQNRADAISLYDSLELWDNNIRTKEMNNQYEQSGGYNSDGIPSGDDGGFPLSQM